MNDPRLVSLNHRLRNIAAHERPSSRVKDLVDLTLLIEQGLIEPPAFARTLDGAADIVRRFYLTAFKNEEHR